MARKKKPLEKTPNKATPKVYEHVIPKHEYMRWSGSNRVQVNKHADVFGMPCRGRHVDLQVLVEWTHRFLTDNTRVLKSKVEDIEVEQTSGKIRDEYLQHKIENQKLSNQDRAIEIAKKKRELVPIEPIRDLLSQVSVLYRSAGETLVKSFGKEAGDILDRTLDDVERLITDRLTLEP